MGKLRLSVLDQSPVPTGSIPADALANSISLARHVDALGYHRLWYSEHHAMDTLASSAPEVLLARIGAETKRVRIGSGGIMLPHYAPLKVAEVFRTLEALYPGRIDLGVGRAPGGGPVESHALRRIRSAPAPDDFPQQLGELLAFLHPELHLFPDDHPFARIKVSPAIEPAVTRPDLWLLGSSMWSAVTAAANGLPYAFAHFFSTAGNTTRAAMEHYQQNFQPSAFRAKPESTIAIGAIVADTQAEADRLHASVRLLQRRIRTDDRRPIATPEEALAELGKPPAPTGFGFSLSEPDSGEFPRYVTGTPDYVRGELTRIAAELNLDELIVNTITHSHEARLRSYTLLAEAFELSGEYASGKSG